MTNINLDWFSFWEGIVPNQKAITILPNENPYTYGEINRAGTKVASTLYHKYGIRKGDRICVLSKNCIESIFLFAAAQKIGFIIVPLNNRLTSFEISKLLVDSEPALLLFDRSLALDDLSSPSMPISSINSFSESGAIPSVSLAPEDPIFILYTSGSTGVPKGVVYTHRMLYWNSLNTSISLGINSETCAMVCMPLFHTGGWNVLLTPVLHHGGHVILTEKFDSARVLNDLEKYRCNQFMAVPTMLKMMAMSPSFENLRLASLPYIIVGGEAMDIELIKLFEEKDIAVRQGFGMTEAGPNLTSLHHEQSKNRIGSIGKPNMYVKVKILDENLHEVQQGQSGELSFSGPIVMPYYWKNQKATSAAFVYGWFRSGDIAMMDEEGYIYIKDRIKNMFISGGENVYPAEIEKELSNHENVSQVAIVGVPDPKWGEVGKAFIVAKNKTNTEELVDFCLSRLSKFKIPKHFEFVAELPLNATGKIDRAALKKRN